MKINFKPKDDNFYGTKELITPIVEAAVVNDKFIGILCEILTLFSTYTEDISNKVQKTMKALEFRIDTKNPVEVSEYAKLKEAVYEFYWQIIGDDFAKELEKSNQVLYRKYGFRFADKRLHRYRGLLLEHILIALVKERFNGAMFQTGCQIYINGRRIIALYGQGNSYHKETMDVCGWIESVKYGEFYECKINPDRFKEENYRYFLELIKCLQENKISNYIVGFVSAESTECIRARIEILEKLEKIPVDCKVLFQIVGRDDLYRTRFYKIPEIA